MSRALVRLLARAAAIAVVAPVITVVGFAQGAQAHGNVSDPPSRNYRCFQVWGQRFSDPAMATADPMCWQAWQANKGSAMWMWSGNLIDGINNDLQAGAPDGAICGVGGAANGRYDVLDTPGRWIATPKPYNFTLNLRDDSSHGADYLKVYVSRQGFDPTTQKLTWADLVPLKDAPRQAPSNNYKVDVSVPTTMTGNHVLLTVWKGSHLDQTYFLCSDVSFGGSTTTSTPTTTTPTTTAPTTTAPTTTRPTTTTTRPTSTTTTTTRPTTTTTRPSITTSVPTSTTAGTKGCAATFKTVGQWTGGFQGEVTVTAGASSISGWKVAVAFPNGQTITQAWSTAVTGSGSSVTASNLSWNGTLGAGASTTFGLLGSWNGTNGAPQLTCSAA
jgi:chitin-binding protein